MIFKHKKKKKNKSFFSHDSTWGFTLLEIIVAIGLFSVVMLIAVGSLLSVIDANRKARALQSVIQNLDFALDSMTRQIRTGTVYHCGGGNYAQPADCALGNGPAGVFAFKDKEGRQVVYQLNDTTKQIERSVDGGSLIAITSPNVTVDSMFVFVFGSTDALQPRMFLSIRGTASSGKSETPFHVQTNVTQRIIDE